MKSELPSSWSRAALADIGEWCGGGTPSKANKSFWQGDIPWVSPKDMKVAKLSDAVDHITDSAIAQSAAKLVAANAVLVVTRSGILAHSLPTATTSVAVALNQDLKALAPGDGIEPEYVAWAFRAFERDILSNCRKGGTTVHSIELPRFMAFDIPVAPTNEQRRIVAKIEELFSELDEGVETLTTARDQLNAYRHAVLKHAFQGKLTAQWREARGESLQPIDRLLESIAPPEQPRGGRQASIGAIEGIAALAVNKPDKEPPAGWRWVPLLRVARQETGHTPSRKHPEYWDGDQYWIGIADARLHHGRVINDTLQKVTLLGLDNSSARTLPSGTVCLSRTASVGYVCVMGKPMATSQDFATWTCTEALLPKFLMYALMAEGREIRRFGQGTTHTTIYFPEIRALHICLPSLEEQEKIVEDTESAVQRIDVLSGEIDVALAQCESLRVSILKSAFSGRLVNQDPSDQPASALLDAIKAKRDEQRGSKKKTKERKRRKDAA